MANFRYMKLAAVLVSFLCVILNIVCLAGTNWLRGTNEQGERFYVGLWKTCIQTEHGMGCGWTTTEHIGYLDAVRGMVTMATMFGLTSLFLMTTLACNDDHHVYSVSRYICFVSLFSGVCLVAAAIAYGLDFVESYPSCSYCTRLDHSFYLSVVAAAGYIISGVLLFLLHQLDNRNGYDDLESRPETTQPKM